jgi:hypothetical protein
MLVVGICTMRASAMAAGAQPSQALAAAQDAVVRVLEADMTDDYEAQADLLSEYWRAQGRTTRKAVLEAVEGSDRIAFTEAWIGKIWVPPGKDLASADSFIVEIMTIGEPRPDFKKHFGTDAWKARLGWVFHRDTRDSQWMMTRLYLTEDADEATNEWQEIAVEPLHLRKGDGTVLVTRAERLPEFRDTRTELLARRRLEDQKGEAEGEPQGRWAWFYGGPAVTGVLVAAGTVVLVVGRRRAARASRA